MATHYSFAHADATRRHAMSTDGKTHRIPMQTGAMERLTAWLAGEIALRRLEAQRLLESAVESSQMTRHHAEFVAAVKALAAGPTSWQDMGYRLLPDD